MSKPYSNHANKSASKVAFIVPRKTAVLGSDGIPVQRLRSNLSLSALTILGAVEDAGFGVFYLDSTAEGLNEHQLIEDQILAFGLPAEAVVRIVEERRPRFILITSMFTFEQNLVDELVNEFKRVMPHTPLILGGIHASVKPEWHFETSKPDFIIIGDGEETIVELLRELDASEPDPRKVRGIAFRGNAGCIERTPPRTRVQELDRRWALKTVLRNPDGEMRYTDRMCRKHEVYVSESVGEDVGTFSLYGSRGCHSRCAYCPTSERDGARVRHMSPEYLFSKFLTVRKKFDVQVFANQADHFGVQSEGIRFLEMVRDYRRDSGDCEFVLNNPNAFFLHQFFPRRKGFQLDIEFLELLEGAGFNTITVAIETLSQRFNCKVNWHRFQPNAALDLCDEIRRRGMKSDIYMMFGFPGQTIEEFDRDIRFGECLLARADVVSWNGVTLLPGTAYYQHHIDSNPGREAEYRRTMRSGYAWHFPIDSFNLSNVPTERFRSALAPFGQSWM